MALNKWGLAIGCAAISLASAAPASAALLHFELTGAYMADWELDSNPGTFYPAYDGVNSDPTFYGDAISFAISNARGNFPGTTQVTSSWMTYYDGGAGGGFNLFDPYDPAPVYVLGTYVDAISATSEALFTGPLTNPVFKTGTFNFIDNVSGNAVTLTISPVPVSPVPEPAGWAMMITGFGLLGGALRIRKAKVSYAA